MATPGILHEEVVNQNGPIAAANVSVGGMLGVAKWGPLATPVKVTSFSEFLSNFGGYLAESDLAFSVKGFFDNGGGELWVSRLAKYDDISDVASHPGVASTLELEDIDATPEPTLDINAKFVGTYGDDIEVSITSNPKHNSILADDVAAAATTFNAGSPSGIYVGQILKLEEGADAVDLATAISLSNLVKSQYNLHLADAVAHNSADVTNVVTSPDATALASLITLLSEFNGDYNAHLADAVAHDAADVTNVVTFADPTTLAECIAAINELKSAYEDHIATAAPVHNSADTTNVITIEEYVKVTGISTSVILGVPTHAVTCAALSNSFLAGSTRVKSTEFDVKVFFEDSVSAKETFKQVSIESDVPNYVETVINSEDEGSIYISVDDLGSASGIGLDTPADIARTNLAGGVSEIGTGITTSDLIGDEDAALGMHAFGAVPSVRLISAVPEAAGATDFLQEFEPDFIHSFLTFCQDRNNTFAVIQADHNDSPSAAIAARNNDGFDSRFGALYYNRIQVKDPLNEGQKRYISPIGRVMGRFAAVDNLSGGRGGVWQAPAGIKPYGNLVGALGVETSISQTHHGLLNDASINTIIKKGGDVVVYGARSLSSAADYLYLTVSRLLMFLQLSSAESLEYAVFRPNTSATANEIKIKLDTFLRSIWQAGGLKGATPEQAFLVLAGEADGVQTVDDTNNGRLIVEVGVAPVKPAEFIIFRWDVSGQNLPE